MKLLLSCLLVKESARIWGWRVGSWVWRQGPFLHPLLEPSPHSAGAQTSRAAPAQHRPSTDLPSPARAERTTGLNWCLAGGSGSTTRHKPCLELPPLCSAEDKNAPCRPFSLPIGNLQRIDAGCCAERCNVEHVACATDAITAVVL